MSDKKTSRGGQNRTAVPLNRQAPDVPLTTKPLAGAFKGMKVGPLCLECQGPIDSREAYSLPNPRGSRKSQRHGWLHADCEETAVKTCSEAQGKSPFTTARLSDGRVIVTPQPEVRIDVLVYTEDEIHAMIEKGVRS